MVLDGERNLSRVNAVEAGLTERNHLQNNERIACQTKILGDIEVTASYWNEDMFREYQEPNHEEPS